MLDLLGVGEVPRSSNCSLVPDEVSFRDQTDRNGPVSSSAAVLPGRRKREPGERSQNVDPARCDADLKDGSGSNEVLKGDSLERRAESGERSKNAFSILSSRLDPEVEVARRPGPAVVVKDVSADDEIPGSCRVEFGQQIEEVRVQLHSVRPVRTPPAKVSRTRRTAPVLPSCASRRHRAENRNRQASSVDS